MVAEYYPLLTAEVNGRIERHEGCNRSDTKIVWCINLWHPEKEIEACISNDGERNATATAIQLGLLDRLKISRMCEKGPFCLTVGKVLHYYDMAIVARKESAPGCTLLGFHEVHLDGRLSTVTE